MFDSGMTVDAVASRVAEIARAAGLSSTFVTPAGPGGAASITVTGWVALAAVAATALVAAGLVAWGVRRWRRGGVGQYTLVVKQGDV